MQEQNNHDTWFSNFVKTADYNEFLKNPVVYFCAEYALMPYLPTYAGGLGVLAGDFVRETGDKKFPMIFIGIFYREGQNELSADAAIRPMLPMAAEFNLAKDKNNERILISIPIHDDIVYAQAWIWKKGNCSVYFLDTNIEENKQADRDITKRLYDEDREIRLKQEVLLGIGGFRLIKKLGINPSVYHLNESHSAFLSLELLHYEMKKQNVDFLTAVQYARKHIILTIHTLVAAGHEQFDAGLVSAVMAKYAEEMEVPIGEIIALGLIEGSSLFSMTRFAFKLSGKTNAVSKIHADKAKEIWPAQKIDSVTNGIYLPRWDKIDGGEEESVWKKHQKNKQKLLTYIKKNNGYEWDKDVLIFGWARRLVGYKRPLCFLEDTKKILSLAHSKRPIKIIFSGPTGSKNDHDNKILIQLKKIFDQELKDVGVFLPNYNTNLAELMTAGCDVWLNTPVVGSEASGSSGMKALLNGALPLSTRDGWIHETNLFEIGWVVDEPEVCRKMLEITENEIIPLYYGSLMNPEKSKWLRRIKNGRKMIIENFSTSRVLKEYIEKIYIPSLAQRHNRN